MKHLHIIGLLAALAAAGCAETGTQQDPHVAVAQEPQAEDEWHLTCADMESCANRWGDAVAKLIALEVERMDGSPPSLTIGIGDWHYPKNDPDMDLQVLTDSNQLEHLGWLHASKLLAQELPRTSVHAEYGMFGDADGTFAAYTELNRNGGLDTKTRGFPAAVQHLHSVVATTVAELDKGTFVFRVSLVPGGKGTTEQDFDYHPFANFRYTPDRSDPHASPWEPWFRKRFVNKNRLIAGKCSWVPLDRVPIASTTLPPSECNDVMADLSKRIQPATLYAAPWVPAPKDWEAVEEYTRDNRMDPHRVHCAIAAYDTGSIVLTDIDLLRLHLKLTIAAVVDASPAERTFVVNNAFVRGRYAVPAFMDYLSTAFHGYKFSPRAQQVLQAIDLAYECESVMHYRNHNTSCDCLGHYDDRENAERDPNAHTLAINSDSYPAQKIRSVPLGNDSEGVARFVVKMQRQPVAAYLVLNYPYPAQ
ncbi:MAG: hypothetical protein Q7T01_02320 [bacterium]|nr:hypothetical protein [bacterium]